MDAGRALGTQPQASGSCQRSVVTWGGGRASLPVLQVTSGARTQGEGPRAGGGGGPQLPWGGHSQRRETDTCGFSFCYKSDRDASCRKCGKRTGPPKAASSSREAIPGCACARRLRKPGRPCFVSLRGHFLDRRMSFEMRSAGGLTCGLDGCLAPCVVSAPLLGMSALGPRGPSPVWAGGPLACPFPHAPASGAVRREPPGPGEGSASFLSRVISPNKGNNPCVAFLFFSGMFHAMATPHPLSVILPVSDGAPAQSGESVVTRVAPTPAPAPSSSPRVPGLRMWSFSNCSQGSRVNCFQRLLGAPHKS